MRHGNLRNRRVISDQWNTTCNAKGRSIATASSGRAEIVARSAAHQVLRCDYCANDLSVRAVWSWYEARVAGTATAITMRMERQMHNVSRPPKLRGNFPCHNPGKTERFADRGSGEIQTSSVFAMENLGNATQNAERNSRDSGDEWTQPELDLGMAGKVGV